MAAVTNYVANKCKISSIEDLRLKLWNLTIKWKQARKLIIKLYFIKREDEKLKSRIIDRMMSIVDELEESTSEMPVVIEGDKFQKLFNDEIDKTVMLNLKPYMNNKAFLRKSELQCGKLDADFSSIGNCYIFDDMERADNLFVLDNSFVLSEVGKDGYDNIACKGQRIAGSHCRCSCIILMKLSHGKGMAYIKQTVYVE